MRKLRKTGAVDEHGNLVTIPRLPSVTGANKPPGWNRWSAAEKAQHLLGLSLDRMHDYLSWPANDLDPHRLAAQTQVIRVVAMVAAKVGDDPGASPRTHTGTRTREKCAWRCTGPATFPGQGRLSTQANTQTKRVRLDHVALSLSHTRGALPTFCPACRKTP
jgi:hypothetical protein